MNKVSIVIPVYFNAPTLEPLQNALRDVTKECSQYAFELIYVDDGSGDDSAARLAEIRAREPNVLVVRLARNFGSNAAILAGLSYASGDAVAFVAADLQDPPSLLIPMIEAWRNGNKVVLAVRHERQDPPITRLFANLFNSLFHALVLDEAPPTGVGFFLIDRQVVNLLLQCQEKNANLMNLIVWLGFRPHLVKYDRQLRPGGRSRWTFAKKIKYAIDTFVAFSYLPIRIASLVGILLAFLGLLGILYVLFARFFLGVGLEGWASLMVVILLLSGVQMVIVGILGEYLWRTLDQSRQRPIFVVDEVMPVQANEGHTLSRDATHS